MAVVAAAILEAAKAMEDACVRICARICVGICVGIDISFIVVVALIGSSWPAPLLGVSRTSVTAPISDLEGHVDGVRDDAFPQVIPQDF